MIRPPSPSSAYVSPLIAAENIIVRARTEKVSKPALASAKRIQKLSSMSTYDLLAAKAPYRVFRWVAWGKTFIEREQRTELALHLHRIIPRRAGRWLDDVQHAVALEVWKRARTERWSSLKPEEVDASLYAAALGAIPKRRRKPKPPAPLPGEMEAQQALRTLREQRVQEAASRPRRPPTFKLRVPKAQGLVQAQQAQAAAEKERRRREAEESLERELSALRHDKLLLEAENRRLRFEVEQLRLERPRERGVSWLEAMAIGAGGFAAGATAMAARQQTDEGGTASCPHCPHCTASLALPAQAPHQGPTRGDGVPAVPEAQEQRPEQHGEHPGQGQQGAT